MPLNVFTNRLSDTHAFFAHFCREDKPGVLAANFIQQASLALQDEILAASRAQHGPLPPCFRSLKQLSDQHRAAPIKHVGVESALTCAAQLCHYIDRVEKEAPDADRHLVGFGIGLLAATAAASASSPAALLSQAIDAVVMAFRVGSLYSFPWLAVDEAEQRLASFHESRGVPVASQAHRLGSEGEPILRCEEDARLAWPVVSSDGPMMLSSATMLAKELNPVLGSHGATGKAKLAILLTQGRDVHRGVPSDRFSMAHPGAFDPRFFNMSPREALQTDPMQRLALVTAYEALETAGFTSDDWREINAAQDIDTYYITGGIRAFGPGRINYFFGFSGPSVNAGECDTALFLSRKGPCATFDDAADGYCRADACASVVVKRLDDALADGDAVLAVVLGSATNHSAEAVSITHPHGPTQSALSSAILDDAGVDALDVDYVEMHGTGTQAGDSTEMLSDRPLFLGSVKSNHNMIPPHIGIKPGSAINSGARPLARSDGKPRRIFINNFSAAGGNTGLLLQDAPARPSAALHDARQHHVVSVTAKSKAALVRNAQRLAAFMAQNPDTPLAHIAYTTTARRMQHNWRIAVSASSLEEARQAIETRAADANGLVAASSKPSAIPFLFTGQGSVYAGMGKQLYSQHSVFRDALADFERIAKIHSLPSFIAHVIDDSSQETSPVVTQLALCCFQMALVRLWASWGVKPSLVMGHSLGEYAALNAAGVLSASDTIYLVGERARLVVAKCEPGTHAMLAVRSPVVSVVDVLAKAALSAKVTVTCINSPQETVLGGKIDHVSAAADKLGEACIKSTQLRVPFAFHSDQVDPILHHLEAKAGVVTWSTAQVPIVSPLLGRQVEQGELNASYLRDHARKPVNFLGALLSAQTVASVDERAQWIEIGPHAVCVNMAKAALGSSTLAVPSARRNESTHKVLSNTLAVLHERGISFDWNEFHRESASASSLVDLPAYSFDEKNYWIEYKGDWTLTRKANGIAKAPVAEKPKLSTTSVHGITSEEIRGDVAVVETHTNLSRPDTTPLAMGHLCNGAPLCPASVYADMAMTVADYAYRQLRPEAPRPGLDVANLQIPHALVFDETLDAHVLRCSVEANASAGEAHVTFFSIQPHGKRVDHATCMVYYGNLDHWTAEFDRMSFLVKARMDALLAPEMASQVSRLGRKLTYKLFSNLVEYESRYQGMSQVYLNSGSCEAAADLVFQTSPEDGDFLFSPYWIDSCAHLSGFILNGTDAVDSRNQVFVSHGWESLKFLESLKQTKKYQAYTRMQPIKDTKLMQGNVYVFDGDRLVGVASGVRFQAIPRKVLDLLLPPRNASASSRKQSSALASSSRPPRPILAPRSVSFKESKEIPVRGRNVTNRDNPQGSLVTNFVNLIQVETGCDIDDLTDNADFASLGCDSLMILTVTGKMREELELDISSRAFADHPTLGQFKAYLDTLDKGVGRALASPVSALSRSPSLVDCTGALSDDSASVSTPASSVNGDKSFDLRSIVRSTIASEMEIDLDEIIAAPDLQSLGLDSLMGLNILGCLREVTGMTIPNDLFTSCASLQGVERSLGLDLDKKPSAPVPAAAQQPVLSSYLPHRKATSVLLQGNQRTATRNLFMVPDGSGSATSYSAMDQIAPDWAVWGLFCPFLKTPSEYTCGIPGAAVKFIEEMKRRQPVGPYALAGWSVGGAIAFEIATQLVRGGDEVTHLVLIDAPCPLIMDPLPTNLPAWFAQQGLLGDDANNAAGKNMPSWLLPHFDASTQALADYQPTPLAQEKCPNVMAIWCEDGVCKTPSDPRPDPYPTGHALFLLDNRSDFGPNQWDTLLDGSRFQTRHMPGNHFTMMRGDLAKKLTTFVREALV
ncbi:hypothetical protein CDD81_8021 [Ophiocordyceps australis]|uniref:Carrier domain-containing protein n=1 Tax=Ophiocordyceps australis TaxID=1399860 RepID=A0A2C5X8T6_9HYPO|nr:hypothetical protein CDD81_8021 [Ophiocordyceps australis]